MENNIISLVGEDIYNELTESVASNVFSESDYIYTLYIHIIPMEVTGHSNDKYYVGKTRREVCDRFGKDGIGYKHSPHFYSAIHKYGWSNIRHYIIMDYLSSNQANYFEKAIIHRLKSNTNKYGYNYTKGGDGGNTKPTTPVKQYDKDGNFIAEYKSAADGARAIGVDRSMISFACKHNGCMGGYQWCYLDEEISSPYARSKQRTVHQFTTSLEYIRSYISPREAERKCKIHRGGVSQACSCGGVRGGYRWSYERLDFKS